MKIDIPEIDATLWLRLKMEAKHRGLQVSSLLREAIYQFLGIQGPQPTTGQVSRLEQLAGTWTGEELAEFEGNTENFGNIDTGLWE